MSADDAAQREALVEAVSQVTAQHRVLYQGSDDRPYKRACLCGAWLYNHEAHVARALLDGPLAPLLAESARLRDRERWFADNLRVPDAGQYRNGWPGAVERCIRDRDEARAESARLVAVVDEQAARLGRVEAVYQRLGRALGRADGFWTTDDWDAAADAALIGLRDALAPTEEADRG